MAGDTYRNPILYGDYSDPDVIRVGEDYYMVSSSFTYLPGVPILHSRDLVHWQIINYAVERLPFSKYDRPCHGSGTWAPSIRYHNGEFFIFIPLVDEGIFVARSRDIRGRFRLNCLVEARGWIDPCPFWDTDGRAWMVFAYARSRCGIQHRLALVEMDPDCTRLLGQPQVIFHNEEAAPTIEGPKLYQREGFYYIFAPAGGVATGWQTVLRARSLTGPYEYRTVLSQGDTPVNGPHQGGWVTDCRGKDWFLHFQDVGALGRILHLQPMTWSEGWPCMGDRGRPVQSWPMPRLGEPQYRIATGDNFSGDRLGLQWQWQANPDPGFYTMLSPGLGLHCLANALRENYLWYAPNALTQIPQHRAFSATVTVTLHPKQPGDLASLGILGHTYAYLALETGFLRLYEGHVVDSQMAGLAQERLLAQIPCPGPTVTMKVRIAGGRFRFFWSQAGAERQPIGDDFLLTAATWTGAKLCLWSANRENRPGGGYGEYQNFCVTKEEIL